MSPLRSSDESGKKRLAGHRRTGKPVVNQLKMVDIPANIAQQIRELITRGALSPGVHLGQVELAERFKVSSAPVREALKLLLSEGVVAHDPNRGFFVAHVSSAEARELYRMRQILEAELISTIEWPTGQQLLALKTRVRELESIIVQNKIDLWSQLHRDFHMQVFDLSPHKFLAREILRLWGLTDRYRSLLPMPEKTRAAAEGTEDEHRLLTMLEKKDRAGLMMVCDEGRSQIERMLIGVLESRGL